MIRVRSRVPSVALGIICEPLVTIRCIRSTLTIGRQGLFVTTVEVDRIKVIAWVV